MTDDPYARLREICLALPEAVEKPFAMHDNPAFRVRDKIFLWTGEDDAGVSVVLKAAPGANEFFLEQEPSRFFKPRYLTSGGWLGVRLDDGLDWSLLESMIVDSYRLIAPKRLSALLEEAG